MLDRSSGIQQSPLPDPVSELLMGMRLRGASYSRLRFSAPFGIGFAEAREAWFHFVAAGAAVLKTPSGEMVPVSCGDAVLLPRGGAHAIVSGPGVDIRPFDSYEAVPLCPGICRVDALEEEQCRSRDVLIFTARMQLELDTLHPLIELMPEFLLVSAPTGQQPEVRPLLDAMEREMTGDRAGSASILARLAEVVAVSVIRTWVECGCGDATGWVAALRDARLGRVLAALHRDPGRNWTLVDMAATMGSSRSVFAERFAAATGTTPLRYVASLRMRLAAQWLTRDRLPVEEVAHRLGYQSQAAFSRAYKRVVGTPPGQARKAR
ncbi:AraC family transcriptional regulator [Stappia sp. TSB10GB4]|uniref:AraC family transcriptional regulator n=1 Tax=Stappia sp. TSB10GB4 TaxID=2003584 RepID=UPI0016453F93|nr:AraC family transcriptional regulator [Stappia sp. TSB10GB4]